MPRLPEDRPIVTSADAARHVLGQVALSSFVGAAGSGPALVAHALASQSARQVVYLAASTELAQKAAGDLGALTLGLPLARFSKLDLAPPHLLAAAESTPYAEVHTDRRAAMLRTSTLYELLSNPARSRLVLTAGALVRRVPPRRALRDATIELVVEHELDVALLSRKLTASGYLRVPVVEDPGSYALRGGLLDIWPGQLPAPIRVELYGDLISSLRTFDPDDQRTLALVERVVAPPARDAIVTDESEARARDLLRSLCDFRQLSVHQDAPVDR